VLLTALDWDAVLWWTMLSTGAAAAALSVTTNLFDRRNYAWPTTRQRFLLHMASYGFLTVSVLVFVLRGFLAPV